MLVFTAVLLKRLYKTHTPCIHYHLRDKTHRSHQGLIKRAHQTPSPLTLSPSPLFLYWRLPLPFCLLFLFPSSQFLGLCSRQVSRCMGSHVFDIRSAHIHFQGQYSLYFSPFVCSIFLVVFLALGVFVFNAFLVVIFLHQLPGFQSYKGV